MGLISSSLGLAGRGIGAIGKGIGGARANATAVAGDLVGMRGSDPLEERDPGFIRTTLPGNRVLANVLFRPHVRGLENIPAEGPVLLVGNHSGGTMIIDTYVFSFAFYRHFGPERRFHQLAHDLAVKFPGLSALLRRYGTVPASHEYAERALDAGAAVLVYPGGDFETFRPSWHSDQIEFGGRGGFVKLALGRDVPIVPVVAIGGQESALFVTRGQRVARLLMLDRLLRIKVLPIAFGPPFGLSIFELPPRLPLPSQVTIEVLPAIDLRETFGDEPDEDGVYEAITAVMQEALDGLSEERDLPLVGTVWTGRAERDAEGSADGDPEAVSPAAPLPDRDDEEGAKAEPEREGRAAAETTAAVELDAPAAAEALPPAAAPGPAPPAEPATAPPPIDDEPSTLVAEFADSGAEEGAGAELRVEEPWEGYTRLRVSDIADRLGTETREALLTARLYEQTHKARRGVLDAVARELKRR